MATARKLNSLSDLGKAWGLKEKKRQPKEMKTRKCFRCGGEMRYVEGTNVIVCTGTKKDKDGKEKPCMNRILLGEKGA